MSPLHSASLRSLLNSAPRGGRAAESVVLPASLRSLLCDFSGLDESYAPRESRAAAGGVQSASLRSLLNAPRGSRAAAGGLATRFGEGSAWR